MTPNYRFTEYAEDDVAAIWEQIADDDAEAAADRFVDRVYDECQKLSEMPGMGHYREELLNRTHRFWRVWSYLIVYKWQTRPIEIIAVVHGARNLQWFFEDDRA